MTSPPRASSARITGGGAPSGPSIPPPANEGYSSTNLLIFGPSGFEYAPTAAFTDWADVGVNWLTTSFGSTADCFYGCGQTSYYWGLPVAETTLSATLSTGGPITSLPVNATGTGTIPSGSTIYVLQGIGSNTQAWTTTAPVTLPVSSIPVASQTPNLAYASGSTVEYGYGAKQATLISRGSVGRVHSVGSKCFMGVRLDTNGAFGSDTVLAPWFDPNWATGSAGVGTALYEGVYWLAAAAAYMGFDGIFFDGEGYTTTGDVGWPWSYTGNTHTQAQTNTQAQLDGQMFANWIAAGWAAGCAAAGTSTNPIILVALDAKAGLSCPLINNNGTLSATGVPSNPITANAQGSVDEAITYNVYTSGYGAAVTTWFWSGFCAANAAAGMPSSLCFVTEMMYRFGQQNLIDNNQSVPLREILVRYQAMTVIAAIGQLAQAFNPTGWNYWYNKVFSTASAWIDGDGTTSNPVDSTNQVQIQFGNPSGSGAVGAFNAYAAPSQATVLYQYTAGSGAYYPTVAEGGAGVGFDYSNGTRLGGGAGSPSGQDYRPAMLNTNIAYLVDSTPPTFGTFSPASGGSHVHGATTIIGVVTTDNVVASIGYSVNNGGEQGAVLIPNLISGPAIPPSGADGAWDAGWVTSTQFYAPVVLAVGANLIEFTVTSVSGLQTTYGYTLTGT